MSTILCIDDEPAVGASLETALTGLGHRPVIAESVEQGMAAVAIELPDLIISDYRMPEATGLDLLDQLRQGGHDIPVIIMTGYASIEQAVLTIRHGAVDYLTKPLRAEALRIAVTNALEVARLREAVGWHIERRVHVQVDEPPPVLPREPEPDASDEPQGVGA